jgi:hypothetical protein
MKKQVHKEFGVYFWVHLILLPIYYLSFILFHWKIVLLIAILIPLQYALLGGCFLTILEFEEQRKNTGYFHYYLKKAGLNFKKRTIGILSVVMPWVILGLALFWQLVLKKRPLLF